MPSLCFIYAGHLTVESYFSHAEKVHSLLLFDLSPFSTSRQVDLIPERENHLANSIQRSKTKEKSRHLNIRTVKSIKLKFALFVSSFLCVQPER